MKRFYKLVSVHQSPDGFGVALDGRPVKTPGGRVLSASSEALAQELVREWAVQEKEIVPDTMPLTQILTTRIDRVAEQRPELARGALNYLNTDLLCYRAESTEDVAKLQEELWGEWLNWFEKRFGTALLTTSGLAALTQPENAHSALREYVQALDDDRFTVLQLVTALSGSLILALAFVEGAASAEQVFEAAHVEEKHKAAIYNEDLHGPDPMQEKKQTAMRRDLAAAVTYLTLI